MHTYGVMRYKCDLSHLMIYTHSAWWYTKPVGLDKKLSFFWTRVFWRHHPDLNRGIKVLQTSALPLGYGAILFFKKRTLKKLSFKRPLERITRLELATSTLARWRSTRWAKSANRGASGRNRTNDTRIFSPLLYRLSYRGKLWRPGWGSNPRPLAWQASVLTNWTTRPKGGNNRARTCDPLLVRQMLSQLSYAPTCWLALAC